MSSKAHISVKTKKILVGTGITFGTLLVFVVSFFLAFTLIVNPIAFSSFGSDDVASENEELKQQVKTLEDEIELLNTTVDKYKNYSGSTVPVVSTPTVTTPDEPKKNEQSPSTSAESETNSDETLTSENNGSAESSFSPETVTTPEGGIEPEVEQDITIIDISE